MRRFRIALSYEDGSVARYLDDSFKSKKGAETALLKIPVGTRRESPQWFIEQELEVEDPDGSTHCDWEEISKGFFNE